MWFLFQELVNCLLKGKTSLTFLIEPLNLKILLKPEFLLDSETIPLTICTFFLALELVTTYFSIYHRALIKGSLGCDLDGISTGCNTYVCSVMSTLCGPMDCIACQVPLSMEFSRQEYWSGSPFPTPGDLPGPEMKPESLVSPVLASKFFTTSATWKAKRHLWGHWFTPNISKLFCCP